MYAPHMSLHHISTTEVLSTSVAAILLTLQIQLIIHTTSLHISVQLYEVCILPSLSYRSHFKTITRSLFKKGHFCLVLQFTLNKYPNFVYSFSWDFHQRSLCIAGFLSDKITVFGFKMIWWKVVWNKVIIEKSRGEVSPMGQDTIENVS